MKPTDNLLEQLLDSGEHVVYRCYGSYVLLKHRFRESGETIGRLVSGLWYITNKRLAFCRLERQIPKFFPFTELLSIEVKPFYPNSQIIVAEFQPDPIDLLRIGIYVSKPAEFQDIITKAKRGVKLPKFTPFQAPKETSLLDIRGYAFSPAEIAHERHIAHSAGISFLCSHCRNLLGTSDYHEFVRRRRNWAKPGSIHFEMKGDKQKKPRWKFW